MLLLREFRPIEKVRSQDAEFVSGHQEGLVSCFIPAFNNVQITLCSWWNTRTRFLAPWVIWRKRWKPNLDPIPQTCYFELVSTRGLLQQVSFEEKRRDSNCSVRYNLFLLLSRRQEGDWSNVWFYHFIAQGIQWTWQPELKVLGLQVESTFHRTQQIIYESATRVIG